MQAAEESETEAVVDAAVEDSGSESGAEEVQRGCPRELDFL